jgi:serine O-acetyltransferase
MERLKKDLERYYKRLDNPPSRWQRFKLILRKEAIWCIGCYRFEQYLQQEAAFLVRVLLYVPFGVIDSIVEVLHGVHIHPKADIGPGLFINHVGGIWINPKAKIGANCNLNHNVTIGSAGGEKKGVPSLGDRVWVGPNATIVGAIKVGSNVAVSANSLVVSDVPDNAIVIGVPAKVISYMGSAHLNRHISE